MAEKEKDYKSQPEEFKSTLFMLLDLVDRYWNGSKSLHQNYKFLGAANQLLNSNTGGSGGAGGGGDDSAMYMKVKSLQDENKKLQHQLQNQKYSGGVDSSSSELQYKNYLQEIVIKFVNFLESPRQPP